MDTTNYPFPWDGSSATESSHVMQRRRRLPERRAPSSRVHSCNLVEAPCPRCGSVGFRGLPCLICVNLSPPSKRNGLSIEPPPPPASSEPSAHRTTWRRQETSVSSRKVTQRLLYSAPLAAPRAPRQPRTSSMRAVRPTPIEGSGRRTRSVGARPAHAEPPFRHYSHGVRQRDACVKPPISRAAWPELTVARAPRVREPLSSGACVPSARQTGAGVPRRRPSESSMSIAVDSVDVDSVPPRGGARAQRVAPIVPELHPADIVPPSSRPSSRQDALHRDTPKEEAVPKLVARMPSPEAVTLHRRYVLDNHRDIHHHNDGPPHHHHNDVPEVIFDFEQFGDGGGASVGVILAPSVDVDGVSLFGDGSEIAVGEHLRDNYDRRASPLHLESSPTANPRATNVNLNFPADKRTPVQKAGPLHSFHVSDPGVFLSEMERSEQSLEHTHPPTAPGHRVFSPRPARHMLYGTPQIVHSAQSPDRSVVTVPYSVSVDRGDLQSRAVSLGGESIGASSPLSVGPPSPLRMRALVSPPVVSPAPSRLRSASRVSVCSSASSTPELPQQLVDSVLDSSLRKSRAVIEQPSPEIIYDKATVVRPKSSHYSSTACCDAECVDVHSKRICMHIVCPPAESLSCSAPRIRSRSCMTSSVACTGDFPSVYTTTHNSTGVCSAKSETAQVKPSQSTIIRTASSGCTNTRHKSSDDSNIGQMLGSAAAISTWQNLTRKIPGAALNDGVPSYALKMPPSSRGPDIDIPPLLLLSGTPEVSKVTQTQPPNRWLQRCDAPLTDIAACSVEAPSVRNDPTPPHQPSPISRPLNGRTTPVNDLGSEARRSTRLAQRSPQLSVVSSARNTPKRMAR